LPGFGFPAPVAWAVVFSSVLNVVMHSPWAVITAITTSITLVAE
jgi:hypothetical protein